MVLSPELVHGLTASKDISNREEHWVVEQCCHVVLIISDEANISIEALTHLEDSAGIAVLFPERLGNVRDGVDADAIEIEARDSLADPLLQVVANKVVILVQIRKA